MSTASTAAIILAGGLSSRLAPRFKPLLPLDGRTPLAWLAETFRAVGVTDITVVIGHRADDLVDELVRLGLHSVYNPCYKTGMYSSVKAGLAVLPRSLDRFFLTPVDVPLFRPATLRRLLDRADQPAAPPTLYPTFGGQRGHPPLLSAAVVPTALGYDGERGLRCALDNFAFDEVPVADACILSDMDTPEEYARLCSTAKRWRIPSVAEAEALHAIRATSPGGLAHARGVAAVAKALGRALLRSGLPLDMELIESAALLHDVAKPCAHHEAAGGALLTELGFDRAAAIVAAHRDIELADDAPLTEKEIVFLADKFVFGRWLVPVADRFQQKLDLYADDPEAVAAITRRLGNARRVLARVEARIGPAIPLIDAAGFRPGPPPAEAYAAFRQRFLAKRQKRQDKAGPAE